MADLNLSLAMADYDRTAALMDGSVKPQGITLTYHVSPPSETFWRMLKFDEFNVSEMSVSSFLIAKSQGRAWTAIPVFPFRAFFHTAIFVRADSKIERPVDLAGTRMGVPEYQVTAAVWMRGVLQHEFGVPPSAIRWYVERQASLSHGGQTGFTPPAGVSVERVPEGQTLFSLFLDGKLDALMTSPYPGMKSMLNKTDMFQLAKSPEVRLLFPDPVAEGVRYYQKTGFSHINHTVVVQDAILKQHPWVALSLFKAFDESKQACYARLPYLVRSSLLGAFGHLEAQRHVFGDDPFPYGLRENRKALDVLAQYSVEQGFTSAKIPADEMFGVSTRQT